MSGPHRTFSFEQGDEGLRSNESTAAAQASLSFHPAGHPDSAYSRINNQRRAPGAQDGHNGPPPPPPHGGSGFPSGQGLGYSPSVRTNSTVTPGMDNLGATAAGGGISGIALGVANSNERESGLEAMRGMQDAGNGRFTAPAERGYNTTGSDTPYVPSAPTGPAFDGPGPVRARDSYGSNVPLGAAAAAAGQMSPGGSTPHLTPSNPSQRSLVDQYPTSYQSSGSLYDGPYQRHSAYGSGVNPLVINPDEIADDGDDGFIRVPQRKSVLGLGHRSSEASPAAAGGAAAGGVLGALGGMVKGQKGGAGAGPSYGPVPGSGLESGEKSEWMKRQGGGSRKMGWIVGVILGVIIVAAIVGGAVGGVLGNRRNSQSDDVSASSNSTDSATGDQKGDLDKDSTEIKALMNNKNLHKVFPGMDYTPWGVQYPLCLKYPPIQNNVTRDIAVLSQLTNNVRLYGTDCNQTEMVLHAIDRLGLTNMKVWLGVWLDTNTTTNERQLKQLYKVLDDTKDKSIFKGAIIGNEALYRAGPDVATAEKNLISYMTSVKSNFTAKNIDLPVATSDLGDNWNSQLVQVADIVMSNIHPFFAGVTVDIAASWAWDFWQQHDVSLTQGTTKKQVISEIGWPSAGGNDCGTNNDCPNSKAGSVAGVTQMNQFMSDWVCQALSNGTDYFWFEAFDEPWKVQFNTPGKDWEDKWGLMDAARKLKPGLKIPDCGGKTAT